MAARAMHGRNASNEFDLGEIEDRYDNYAVLSRLFRAEVDGNLLHELRNSPIPNLIGYDNFDEGCIKLFSCLRGAEDEKRMKSELAVDFALIFLGYGIDPNEENAENSLNAAYPYESIYKGKGKTLTGGLLEGVTLIYNKEKFSPIRERIIADDHIACELEYLKYLVGCELDAAKAGLNNRVSEYRVKELEFIEEHPLTWIIPFRQAIESRAETDFYKALAQMVQGWLEFDSVELRKAPALSSRP